MISLTLARSDDSQLRPTAEPGLLRQLLSHDPNLMLVRHTMQAGWVGTLHHHPHLQILYVVRGAIHLTAGDQQVILHAGDSYLLPGDLPHQASAPIPSEVLDIFTPTRTEYL